MYELEVEASERFVLEGSGLGNTHSYPNLSLTWGSCGFVSDVAEGGPRMQTVLGIILASQSDDRGKARAPGVA